MSSGCPFFRYFGQCQLRGSHPFEVKHGESSIRWVFHFFQLHSFAIHLKGMKIAKLAINRDRDMYNSNYKY